MSKLGPWEQAAMKHELGRAGDLTSTSAFVGGMIMGMMLALKHPEYAQAAVRMSQESFTQAFPDAPKLSDAVEEFIQAVPVTVRDEANCG